MTVNLATTPALVDVPETTSISSMLADRVARTGDGPLLERRETPQAPWVPVSANAFAADVMSVARGLLARGVEVGDRVAIMSRTRYEWTLVDYAVWAVGGVPVPVYETSSPDQVEWILSDAGCRFAVVETAAHAGIVDAVRASVAELEDVLVIDAGALEALRAAGEAVAAQDVTARSTATRASDLATIIYTSGSTGRPKGAELTHGNFAHVSRNAAEVLPEVIDHDGARTLLFLPIAHVFARLIQVAVLSANTVLGHAPDVKNLVADLGSFKPTFLLAVPRVFEKVYNSAEQKASASPLKRKIFYWAARTSIATSRAREAGPVPPALALQHKLADRLVLSKLREAMGGAVVHAVSGGAPLGERLGHFFRGVGVTVLEGYGLTETTAPAAVNLPRSVAIGTVGPPLPGTSVQIDDDGEILLKGPHIFRGYRNQPELTAEVLVDGWFHTGDLGTLDSHGRLRITGRKKEIIVTAGGKNVAPALLEDRLRSHPLVSQVVVVGDQRPFIGALVTLDPEMLPGWLATHGLPNMPVSEARVHPDVLAALDRAVTRANEAVSRAESIRKFHVLENDFTEANGYLTPSLKVKRALVIKDFASVVDGLYAGAPTTAA
ncbi:AMP-dependent synthetase/ligase [Xylanimonas protaetiae]|uniref:Acyl-CoA synthetase n=1 Tax=Xylanimonas protaetiae TaxID=2509457 RepID=A0A4P6F6S4_9MICO|nr:AMP-dependent synthetase/ligase [Xylanimonas protaetiae]QAY70503.1 long-chain fatty acid--CoA ligase [Xylanimonas protaetiae]